GDVGRVVGDQPRDGAGDVFPRPVATERDRAPYAFELLLARGSALVCQGTYVVEVHLGRHVAGSDGVYPNTERCELERQYLAEQRDPGLGGGVAGVADDRLLREDRARIHDRAPSALTEELTGNRPRHQERADQVHLDHPTELLDGRLSNRRSRSADAGEVD